MSEPTLDNFKQGIATSLRLVPDTRPWWIRASTRAWWRLTHADPVSLALGASALCSLLISLQLVVLLTNT